MLLSNDLIRDTLKCVNEKCEAYTDERGRFGQPPHNWRAVYENQELNSKYIIDDVKYCLVQLYEAGLIYATIPSTSSGIKLMEISGLTWEGHELLKNISNDSVWDNVKKKLGSAAGLSMKVVASVATEAATAYVKSQIGL